MSQRTRESESDLDVQRGLLAGVLFGNLSLIGHVLNPAEEPIYVISIGAEY